MILLKPKALELGDTIGIIAPSSPVPKDTVEKSLEIFTQYGYRVKLGKTVHDQYGYLAGTDEARAHDVNRMFADQDVDAIFCLRGGYGSPRILDRIDYECIRNNPKIFVGYSDITALHAAIHQKTGLVTFHGPMVAELVKSPHPLTWPTLFAHLTSCGPVGRYTEPADMFQYSITEGEAEGPLVGGNLCLLVAALGTPYEIETKDKILFIEDIGEEPYSIDRMLTQMSLAGKLQSAKGIVFTDLSEADPKVYKNSLTIEQILHDIVKPIGIPSYYGLKAGHCQPNLTMPYGVHTRLNATEGWIEFLEGGVKE